MSFDSLLPETMDVKRPRSFTEATAVGTPKRVRATVTGYNAVPCRFEQLSGIERLLAGREGVENIYRLYYGPDYTLQESDEVVRSTDGETYEIEGIQTIYDADSVHHFEAMAVLRK